MNRRSFLCGTAALLAGGASLSYGDVRQVPDTLALKRAARQSGKTLGMYVVGHDLQFDPTATAIIANTFSMIADGNDLKFGNRLRPTPDTFKFGPGRLCRGLGRQSRPAFSWPLPGLVECAARLVSKLCDTCECEAVMADHITNTMRHYAGRVYSWDVVNEPIHNDGRPDQLRRKPWLDLIGSDYIDIAFRTAAEADPKAKLIVNECYIEHATPGEIAGVLLSSHRPLDLREQTSPSPASVYKRT